MWIKYFTDIWPQRLGNPGVTADSEGLSTWIGKMLKGVKTSEQRGGVNKRICNLYILSTFTKLDI